MYDGRCTMYDLGSSRALRGIWQSKCGRDVMELCAGVVRKGRGRLTAPMYDGRRTMYNTHDGCKCVWTARRRCPQG